ncbi:MAG: carbon storage regulator CsrA [Deltaproteobacteria bacterium]|nr:carbon storage regulator CsrA [Deltaproteobacteria bacterium]
MLVLTRRPGQSVYIGDDVKVTLVEIKGNQVRIGIDAPPTVRIFREEIYLQILEENRSAAALSASSDIPSDLGGMTKFLEKKPDAINKFKIEKKRFPKKKDGPDEGGEA